MSPITVHILRHGRTLCLSVHGRPSGWGTEIKWVSFLDPMALEHATCTTCKEALALIPREVLASAPASATRARPSSEPYRWGAPFRRVLTRKSNITHFSRFVRTRESRKTQEPDE